MISGGDLEKVTLYKWATPFIATFKADDKSPRERKDYQIVWIKTAAKGNALKKNSGNYGFEER